MDNDKLLITLPINPYDEFFVGKMTTPILGESLKYVLTKKYNMQNLFGDMKERNKNV